MHRRSQPAARQQSLTIEPLNSVAACAAEMLALPETRTSTARQVVDQLVGQLTVEADASCCSNS
jgi:hypothetical protein